MTTLLQTFVSWVAAQPPRKRYEFKDVKQCALAQFARAHFRVPYVVGGVYGITVGQDAVTAQTLWLFVDEPKHNSILPEWGMALINSTTFGQLAKRLTPIMEKINAIH